MPTAITGIPATDHGNPVAFNAPADLDAINAASVNVAFQAIADVLANLQASLGVAQQISAASGNFQTTDLGYVDVTNLEVSLETIGRPVLIMVVPDTSGASSGLSTSNTGTEGGSAFKLLRDAVNVGELNILAPANGSAAQGSMMLFDAPGAGVHTYKLQAKANAATTTSWVTYMKLLAFEL